MPDPRAIQRLSQLTNDTNQWVAVFAVLALWKLDPGAVHTGMASNLISKGDAEFRASVITVLPRISPPNEALQFLRSRVDDA